MKKIGLICLAVVLAVGAIGFGYANWTDTVVVEENVATGNVCVEFQYPLTFTDPFPPPTPTPDWTCDPVTMNNVRPVAPPKNVGWGEGIYVDTDADTYYDTLQVTLHDVYPCYYNHVDFWVHNCGTIPVILTKVTIDDGTTTQDITANGVYYLDLNGNGIDDFEIKWGNHLGAQFEPCDDADISFGMHMLQDDDPPDMQGQSYTFYLTLHFVQWNMVP